MSPSSLPARVHRVAASGFTKGARAYERARPGYPRGAVEFVARVAGLSSSSTVVDLGAGTGKLTRELVRTRAKVVAVEPLAAMRSQFRRAVPGVRVFDGTAERTGLPGGFADLVTVGQAFHWFDHVRALREIRRVLKPGGTLAILWNVREDRTGWRRAVAQLARSYDDRRVPRHRWNRWRKAFVASAGFTPLRLRLFHHRQRFTPRELETRFLSISYLADLEPVRQAEFLQRMRELLRTQRGTRGRRVLVLPYETEVYWCFRREQAGPRSRTSTRGRPARRRRRRARPLNF